MRKVRDDISKNYVIRINSGKCYKENYKGSKGYYEGYSADTKRKKISKYSISIHPENVRKPKIF